MKRYSSVLYGEVNLS